MKRLALLLALCCAAPAMGQGVVAPQAASAADVATALSAAQSAQTQAANAVATANGAQAAIPPACTTAPSADTLNGTVGSSPVCTPSATNTRPTAVQAGNVTGGLLANCTFSVTFARSFISSVPFVYSAVVDTSANQMPCKAQTRSATGFTGICSPAQTSLLTINALTSAALTGINLSPFGSLCTAGTPVTWVAREPTQ